MLGVVGVDLSPILEAYLPSPQAVAHQAPVSEHGHGRAEVRTAKTVQLGVTEALALSRPAPHSSSHQHSRKQHPVAAEASAGAPGSTAAAEAPRKLHRQKSGTKRLSLTPFFKLPIGTR